MASEAVRMSLTIWRRGFFTPLFFCTVASTVGRLKFVCEMVGSEMICELHQDNFFLVSLIEMEDSRLGDSFLFGWDQGWPF